MNLAKYLEKHQLTQTEFAERVGVSPAMVSQWVTGYRPVAPKRALLIDSATNGEVSKYDLCPDVYPRESEPVSN